MTDEPTFYEAMNGRAIRVYLINGIRLEGTLLGNGEHALFLEHPETGTKQIIYKHSIATASRLESGARWST
jgi:RNA chaperone Hfq